ncbi:Carboxyl-terminal-processing protease [Micractinium conductrix]|uniref:Carboxyl-terminal-processing protease n=1 Tax=Micractinium conductrix TaxID=554055 RepID=A0A2P6V9I9_9CHLO|nr:Carboxyl-terminal-processing protease [Micractinium conductrix]|eukprot:PSC70752.1 Carboxyl-terminal-processing protease [Micractinium conductrix]
MAEAWTIVTQTYVDASFNNTQWDEELVGALTAAADAKNAEEARQQIPQLLGKLGDPFTRWLAAKDYRDFRIGNDGELQGVGMLIASDPSSGRTVVLAPIKGSPAEQAGIQPGDELLNVDGTSIDGLDTDSVAQRLRGQEGSSVWVKVARRHTDEIPGVAGAQPDGAVEYKQFRLQRASVELNPVFATPLLLEDHVYGYVRLVNFSGHAAHEMQRAIWQLKRDGAEAFILDLRNNPGGLVNVALDVAGLWMDGPAPVFNVMDRTGEEPSVQAIGLAEPTHATTDLPMVVLVNRNSASASEILAGALHDNRRAEVLGEPTYGKGKIQSVFELGDGSALFVTVAKYQTPAGSDIDQIGVQPDRACAPLSGPGGITGIPVGPGASAMVMEELSTDECVLTAEQLLQKKVEAQPVPLLASAMRRAPPLVAAMRPTSANLGLPQASLRPGAWQPAAPLSPLRSRRRQLQRRQLSGRSSWDRCRAQSMPQSLLNTLELVPGWLKPSWLGEPPGPRAEQRAQRLRMLRRILRATQSAPALQLPLPPGEEAAPEESGPLDVTQAASNAVPFWAPSGGGAASASLVTALNGGAAGVVRAEEVRAVLPWLFVAEGRLDFSAMEHMASQLALSGLQLLDVTRFAAASGAANGHWHSGWGSHVRWAGPQALPSPAAAAAAALRRMELRRGGALTWMPDMEGKAVVLTFHPGHRQLAAETLALYLHAYLGLGGQEAVEAAGRAVGTSPLESTLRGHLEELATIADGWYRRVTLAWPYAGGHVEVVGDAVGGWEQRAPLVFNVKKKR